MLKIIKFISIIILSTSMLSYARQSNISKTEIKELEASGHLISIGNNAWKTKGGVILKGRDPEGLNRLEHIMRHTSDMPHRPKHGVFNVTKAGVIELLDEVWSQIKSGSLKGNERGGRTAYTYNTEKAIGFMGGKDGGKKGHPKLKSVRIVLKNNTSEVVTFFPY